MLQAAIKRTAKATAQREVEQKVAAFSLRTIKPVKKRNVASLTAEDVVLKRVNDGSFFKQNLIEQEELIPAFVKWGRQFVDKRCKQVGLKLAVSSLKRDFEMHKERAFIRSWYGHFNCCWDDYRLREFAASAAKKAGRYVAKKGVSQHTASFLLSKLVGTSIGLDSVESLEGILGRLTDEYWWRTKLRKVQDYRLEQLQRDLHYVGGSSTMYLSDVTFRKREIRTHNNTETLDNLYAVADTDDGEKWLNLSAAANGSQSNPLNRAAFMAVRIKGLRDLAQSKGMQSAFVTITAPSRFHSVLATGAPNPHYMQGGSASKANEWFKLVMSRIRADWQRHGLNPFGVRVAELHHDGCPHWHILLFAEPMQMHPIHKIMHKHALFDGGHELKNTRVRFDWQDIDPQKGDAVGYVIKYVAKGVDSRYLESVQDVKHQVTSNDDNHIATLKMKYGLSVSGIQQFNFFGLPAATATVWQELRRLGKGAQGMQQLNAFAHRYQLCEPQRFALTMLYKAADAGDWATYCQAMGGIYAKRSDAVLQILYSTTASMNALDQACTALNKYGEPLKDRVKGIKIESDWREVHLITRQYHYQVVTQQDYQRSAHYLFEKTLSAMDVWERYDYYQELNEQRFEQYAMLMDHAISLQEGVIAVDIEPFYSTLCHSPDRFAPCGSLAAATDANAINLDLCQ